MLHGYLLFKCYLHELNYELLCQISFTCSRFYSCFLASRFIYLCSHMFRSICSIECFDHMLYVDLIVCIICIHMITLGSPCKRHEVLVRARFSDSQARKSWLGHEVRIANQEVMARARVVWIAMHGRLSRGKGALDRELAYMMVGLGVWIDIDSNRAGYIGYVCTLAEFLIFHRCWLCVGILPHFPIGLGKHRLHQIGELRIGHFVEFLICFPYIYISTLMVVFPTRGCFLLRGFTTLKNLSY